MALSKKKKAVIGILGLAIVAVAVKTALGGAGNAAVDMNAMVSTTVVERQDLQEIIKQRAVLQGTESVEVVSRLHYEVTELLVQEGDKVTKGQLLARLDTADLNRQISVLNGDVALIQHQHEETLSDRQRDYDEAKLEYDRTKELFDAGAATQKELDDAKAVMDKIPTENGMAILKDTEKQQLANTNQQRSNQAVTLQDCEIRSLIDGTVTRVNTKVGRFADETDDDKPMFVIENIDKLEMKVMINEADIGKIEVGQTATITADILKDKSVQGEVVRISPTGEEKTPGSAERVIPVYVEVKETNDRLIAGITAKAEILVNSAENVLILPFEAIAEVDGEDVVYVLNEDNTIHIVPVTLGLETDIMVEVQSSELTEGAQVVMNPSLALTEGMTVVPQ